MTPLYAGIGGVVRELTEMYTGVGGVVKPMTEMWAGVDGVKRQIFSAMQTWQKWDIKTTYKYSRETSTNTRIFLGFVSSYSFYSSQLPAVTSTEFQEKPTSLSQIFPSLVAVSSMHYTSPVTQAGYYTVYDDVRRPILAKIFYMSVGESITKDSGNYGVFPSKRTTYYPRETTIEQKGDNLLEYVTAPIGTYPSNGTQDGYWWVLVE